MFFGTKIVDDISLDDVEKSIDRDILFRSRWQFGQNMDIASVIPVYEKILSYCRAEKIIIPKYVYGFFRCKNDGNGLVVEGERKEFRFNLPREKKSPNRCLADFFPEGVAALFVATVGREVVDKGAKLFGDKKFSDMFYLKGFAAEAAEAVAQMCHMRIREEFGIGPGAGQRFSPGFPAFPDIFEQRKIFKILNPERIGVSLTETCQMIPEYSVSAIVSPSPNAVLFRP